MFNCPAIAFEQVRIKIQRAVSRIVPNVLSSSSSKLSRMRALYLLQSAFNHSAKTGPLHIHCTVSCNNMLHWDASSTERKRFPSASSAFWNNHPSQLWRHTWFQTRKTNPGSALSSVSWSGAFCYNALYIVTLSKFYIKVNYHFTNMNKCACILHLVVSTVFFSF